MKQHCYRRISHKEKLVLGLELADLLVLQILLMVLLVVTGSLLVTVPSLVGLYLVLRLFKKNKPRFYTERLVRFLLRPRFLNLPPRDGGGLRKA